MNKLKTFIHVFKKSFNTSYYKDVVKVKSGFVLKYLALYSLIISIIASSLFTYKVIFKGLDGLNTYINTIKLEEIISWPKNTFQKLKNKKGIKYRFIWQWNVLCIIS